MKIRVTLEYELDDPTEIAKEQQDWINGEVTFQDIWYLFNEGEPGFKVRFETVEDEQWLDK